MNERGQPFAKNVSSRQPCEVASGDAVLRLDPGRDFRIVANIVLQPAIGIVDPLAEMFVGGIDLFGCGIEHYVFSFADSRVVMESSAHAYFGFMFASVLRRR